MSKIICLNEKCPYRSTRPLRTWTVGGKPAYSCKLPVTVMRGIFDIDGEIYGYLGYVPIECKKYAEHRINGLNESEDTE